MGARRDIAPAARRIVDRCVGVLHELAPLGPQAALPALDEALARFAELRGSGVLGLGDYDAAARELLANARGLRLIDDEERTRLGFAAGLPG